jgi:RNA polymerase sigma factor (sigma-70 family)
MSTPTHLVKDVFAGKEAAVSEPSGSIVDAELRAAIPLVTTTLLRRYGDFAACEDAVQEALIEALDSWPTHGRPQDVKAWLLTVARRRYIDAIRSDAARRTRENRDAQLDKRDAAVSARDDSLALLVLCCHPALQPLSQLALTLRSVCGLTTAQIAAAFFQSETAMSQRITRAKRTIDEAGRRFEWPSAHEFDERAELVRTALYLMFTEGYAPSLGQLPVHVELIAEAIRLTRMLHEARPADQETTALLALMLLSDARTASRTGPDGLLVALPDQDRSLWDQAKIREGRRLAADALTTGTLTPIAVQAAIAAVHAAAADASSTDWDHILGLYDTLVDLQPGPAARLGRSAAVGMAMGSAAGLAELDTLEADERLARSHRLLSVRAGLLEQAGAFDEASDAYIQAGLRTSNVSERRWLQAQAQRLQNTTREEEKDR